MTDFTPTPPVVDQAQRTADGPRWLVEFLRDPPMLVVATLFLLGVLAILLVAHVFYNRGVPYDLHRDVMVNVGIVQGMVFSSQFTRDHLALSLTGDLAVALGVGGTIWLAGHAFGKQLATERGLKLGWAALGAIWIAQSVQLALEYDSRVAMFHWVLATIAIWAVLYVDRAGEKPVKDLVADSA